MQLMYKKEKKTKDLERKHTANPNFKLLSIVIYSNNNWNNYGNNYGYKKRRNLYLKAS